MCDSISFHGSVFSHKKRAQARDSPRIFRLFYVYKERSQIAGGTIKAALMRRKFNGTTRADPLEWDCRMPPPFVSQAFWPPRKKSSQNYIKALSGLPFHPICFLFLLTKAQKIHFLCENVKWRKRNPRRTFLKEKKMFSLHEAELFLFFPCGLAFPLSHTPTHFRGGKAHVCAFGGKESIQCRQR